MGSRKAPKTRVAAEITLGCCGFPVPPTRYFQDFGYVEVQDVTPGMGTIRRWKREAPPSFRFAVIAPREIAQEAYRDGKVTEGALANLRGVMEDLSARVAIFLTPPEFAPTRANKNQLEEFFVRARPLVPELVWEPPATWDAEEALALAEDAGVIAARDPLAHGNAEGAVGYYRMPGPAGFKSRYEDPAIEKLAELARSAKHERATYIFANVDMFADAKRFRKALG